MSRKTRFQNIDGLITTLSIAKNQCSLSENDVNLLDDAIAKLNRLRMKKGLTDKQYKSEITDIITLLIRFFNLML